MGRSNHQKPRAQQTPRLKTRSRELDAPMPSSGGGHRRLARSRTHDSKRTVHRRGLNMYSGATARHKGKCKPGLAGGVTCAFSPYTEAAAQ